MSLLKILKSSVAILGIMGLVACEQANNTDYADVVFLNGKVYTVDEANPWAAAVVVEDNKIIGVYAASEAAEQHIGKDTKIIDLKGRMLVPGFVDGHTHFNRAGAQLVDANLLQVSTNEGLQAEISRAAANLDKGEWITRGLWGAYEAWGQGAKDVSDGTGGGAKMQSRWRPHRDVIEDLTKDNPVFISSYESALYLANEAALRAAGLFEAPVTGMTLDEAGAPTGLIDASSPAIEKLKAATKAKSHARLMNEARVALKAMAAAGVTEIHDITHDDQMELYEELKASGELTARIWMRADLARAKEFNDRGLKMGMSSKSMQQDPYLRWGAYKGYIDGIMGGRSALFFEPYDDDPTNYGRYRHHTSDDAERKVENMEKMYGYLVEANKGGFVANVHAIGTKGSVLMLNTYERLMEEVGKPLEGYRVIHSQVLRQQDFPRFKKLGVYAEINPYHLSDDMRWMEERIGPERIKGAYAFKSLLDNGAELIFGSDWPGTQAAEYYNHPKYLLHAAVNRTTLNHEPTGGWFPDEKISMADALKAYTLNGATGAFNGDTRGSIQVGKVADLVIIDKNLFEIAPKDILTINIDLTMVDGKIVFER